MSKNKVNYKAVGVPVVAGDVESSQGDLIVSKSGDVFIESENGDLVCIVSGKDFSTGDYAEYDDIGAAYLINPEGLSVLIAVVPPTPAPAATTKTRK